MVVTLSPSWTISDGGATAGGHHLNLVNGQKHYENEINYCRFKILSLYLETLYIIFPVCDRQAKFEWGGKIWSKFSSLKVKHIFKNGGEGGPFSKAICLHHIAHISSSLKPLLNLIDYNSRWISSGIRSLINATRGDQARTTSNLLLKIV